MALSAAPCSSGLSPKHGSSFIHRSAPPGVPIKELPGGETDILHNVSTQTWLHLKRSLHHHVLDLVADTTQCDNTFVHHSILLLNQDETQQVAEADLSQRRPPWAAALSPKRVLHIGRSLETYSEDFATTLYDHSEYVKPVNAWKHSRSLTETSPFHREIMAAVDTAPGSPPELSDSRSSKTSSYASDTYQQEALSASMMNFEDISLGDDKSSGDVTVRSLTSHEDKENASAGPKRSSKRPSLSTLQTSQSKARLREDGINSAIIPQRRGFTSPVIPMPPHSSRPRSSSPMTRAMHSSRNALSPSTALNRHPQRRSSWQPQRKSVAEIEAEYHDSDDDLPDDASLFNVPISPFATTNWVARSQRSSARGSPERESPSHSPAPIPLAHTMTEPSSPPSRRTLHSQSVPRHRMMSRSASHNMPPSNPTSPQIGPSRNGRTRSWNLALSELSDEARSITEKLEFHLENGGIPSSTLHRSSAPSSIPLPPIQKGTLDFMPISKEKEAILSRTRPSWLPPKDPKEEKKHLREYQQMMKASLEAEKKREEQQKRQHSSKDDTRDSLIRIWNYYIEPATDITTIDARVNDLCWRGVPPNLRGKVWQRKIGNSLGLTPQSYVKAIERAREIKAQPMKTLSEHEKNMAAWFADIERDAETAFPDLRVFQRHGQHWQDLINVCEAYACYRSDVGYFYGLQLMAALLLLQLSDPAEVFILLANCLNRAMPSTFQNADIGATKRTFAKIKASLDSKNPRLYQYLFGPQDAGNLGFDGAELLEPMLKTLFANGLDVERLCRAWDIWIFEGDRWLMRTAVALLGGLQQQIFDIQGDMDLRRRNVQEMLGWGPFNRVGGYWTPPGDVDAFVDQIQAAGRFDAV